MPDSSPIPLQRLASERDVAELFGVHPRTVRNWARSGLLQPVRIGGITRYRTEDLDAVIHPTGDTPTAA